MKEIMEVVLPAGEDLAKKLEPLDEAKRAQLEELAIEHDKSHKKSECNACIMKTHEIHSRYDPEMNRLVETAWMDVTNFVCSRYMQRVKPNLEAMYVECMKHILLISDSSVRARTEENLKTEIEQFIYMVFSYVGKTEGDISVSGSVSIKGEVTVDGKGNVVSGDIAAAAQGTVATDLMEASGTYEASVQRGCKLSAEVTRLYNYEVVETPEELGYFLPEKPKKVLWQGEYQFTK